MNMTETKRAQTLWEKINTVNNIYREFYFSTIYGFDKANKKKLIKILYN